MAGIELSEKACQELVASGAQAFLNENLDTLLGMLFDCNPKTVSEIYESAVAAMKEVADKRPESVADIRAYADNKDPFFFGQLLMLMSCYLRDEAMKEVEVGSQQ